MAEITLGGNKNKTNGSLPETGYNAPDFNLLKTDLSTAKLVNYKGKKIVMNIFPSIDTGVCATSVRKFNEKAAGLDNTKVLCISRDLPFAQARFCGSEGLINVECLSDFKTGDFGKEYGVEITDGAFAGLHARAVIVLDENANVIHRELVSEIGNEPDYEAALSHL